MVNQELVVVFVVVACILATLFFYRWQYLKRIDSGIAELRSINQHIDFIISGSAYIRDSLRAKACEQALAALNISHSLTWLACAKPEHKVLATNAKRFITRSKEIVAQANESFMASQLAHFAHFFDTIENKPLTDCQRYSCVVCEDRNLVLAGAGTGKTSTMIGRAGYLIASGQARPDEILMLAFSKIARGEMQERQDERLKPWTKEGTPSIKTFHALGLEIIVFGEGKKPDITPFVDDAHLFKKFVDDQLEALRTDEGYKSALVYYFRSELYSYNNPFDFASMEDYIEYARTNEFRTLKGERVKSYEEVVIANFLCAHGVAYEYEKEYKYATRGPDHRQYKPDFYLTDHNIYLEHFALDRNGNPPMHFDTVTYLAGVIWKRNLHTKQGTRLLETYSHFKRDGILESRLYEMLLEAKVPLRKVPDDELLALLRENEFVSDLARMISEFIPLFKESGIDMSVLRLKADADYYDRTRLLAFVAIVSPILDAYEKELSKNNHIDFSDMIRKATSLIDSGTYASPYAHILVDEFQDISATRAALVLSLLKQRPDTILFAVGDDWQSIYRFTGSNIGFTRDFSDIFGPTVTTTLDLTFRFNDQIGSVASKFILKNPDQLRKEMRSHTTSPSPAISIFPISTPPMGLEAALVTIHKIVQGQQVLKASVLVLGRFHFTIDEFRDPACRRKHKQLYPALDIDYMTVHAAKGKEADYVVLMDLNRGKFGFPCEKPPDTIMKLLLPPEEPFAHAEERRLFYVAITRARHRAYLVYNPENASEFVNELLDPEKGYSVTRDEFGPAQGAVYLPNVPCPKCKGRIVPRRGQYGSFAECNNYPFCTYADILCPICNSPMSIGHAELVCTNSECNSRIPSCPKCGGAMIERTGTWGRFWGCASYRGDAKSSCRGKLSIDQMGMPVKI